MALSIAGFAGACGGGDDTAPQPRSLPNSTASGAGATGGGGEGGVGGVGGNAGAGGAPFMTAPHRGWPALPKAGSGLMASPRLVLIAPMNETAGAASTYQALGDALPASSWYGSWAGSYALGVERPTRIISGAALVSGQVVDKTNGPAYIDAAIASAADPSLAPDGNTIYLIMLPQGVTYVGETMATGVHGHHWAYGSTGDGWAVVERNPQGFTLLSVMTAVGSHEIAEAATDTGNGYRLSVSGSTPPWQASVWAAWEGVNAAGGYIENGDFCIGTRYREANNVYQRIYTNEAAAQGGDPCVPALPVPYFNVSADKEWYPVAAGNEVTIPITGWSTAPTDDFWITAEIASYHEAGDASFVLETPKEGMLLGKATPQLNNGVSGSFKVTIPAGDPSGSWVVLSLWTWHAGANNVTPVGEDQSHLFAVGVYVP